MKKQAVLSFIRGILSGYDLKYHEVNKSQHKRVLALTARKPVRLIFRLLKDSRLYNRW